MQFAQKLRSFALNILFTDKIYFPKKHMNYNKIDKYKKYIIHEKRWNVFFVIFGAFLTALILWGAFSTPKAIVVAVFTLPPAILGITGIIKSNRILNELANIEKYQVINQTNEIKLSSPKVVFLTKIVYHGRWYQPPEYYGIKIIDGQKNKYYYFFDDYFKYDKFAINMVRAKFTDNLCIQCYQNTSIIRTIENDPRFINQLIWKKR